MRRFKDEFNVELNEIDRSWLRKSVTIYLSLIIIGLSPLIGMVDTLISWWNDFLLPCWRGEKEKDDR